VKGRQYYEGKFTGAASKPRCSSVEGIVPVNPHRGSRFPRGMAEDCANCFAYKGRMAGMCADHWSLIAVVPAQDGIKEQVRQIFFNATSQAPLKQHVVQINKMREAQSNLRPCDFTTMLYAEMKKGRSKFSLGFPIVEDIHRIKFTDGKSMFDYYYQTHGQQYEADFTVVAVPELVIPVLETSEVQEPSPVVTI
jgi:hypothetical protein